MSPHSKTRWLPAAGLVLILPIVGGCAACDGTWLSVRGLAYDLSPRRVPEHHEVCRSNPAFYGYHSTCWLRWPDGWAECTATAGAASDIEPPYAGDVAGAATIDFVVPPEPDADWEIVPVAKGAGSANDAEADPGSTPFRDEGSPPSEGPRDEGRSSPRGRDASLGLRLPGIARLVAAESASNEPPPESDWIVCSDEANGAGS